MYVWNSGVPGFILLGLFDFDNIFIVRVRKIGYLGFYKAGFI